MSIKALNKVQLIILRNPLTLWSYTHRVSLHLNDKGQSMYRYNDLTINSMESVNEKPINLRIANIIY